MNLADASSEDSARYSFAHGGMKHYNLKIHGDIQGVGFRYACMQKAHELGITGFVRNETDGTVHIECEGKSEKLDEFVEWCKQGHKFATIEEMKVSIGEIKNFKRFEILK